MKATEVTAGLAESNGSLLPGLWRDSLHVTCGLTACTPRSAPGPTLGNEYGKTLPFLVMNIVVDQLYSFNFAHLANTLLKDEESARDNHVLAYNISKYLPIKKNSLTDSATKTFPNLVINNLTAP